MSPTIVIRPVFGRVLAIVCAVLAGYIAVSSFDLASMIVTARVFAGCAAFTGFMWLLFWRPAVTVGAEEVELKNVFRSVTIPFARITAVDTRFALTISVGTQRYTAWAAPAPGRHSSARTTAADTHHVARGPVQADTVRPSDVPGSDSGDAATLVRERWQAARACDMPSDATSSPPEWTWSVPSIASGSLFLVTVAAAVMTP